MSEEGFQINLDAFHQAIDTWIPSEREGYRLYAIESLTSGPSDQYAVVKYSWGNEHGEVLGMGHAELDIELPDKEKVNSAFEDEGLTPLTDKQWALVRDAYEKMGEAVLRDQLFDGVPQMYQFALYHEIEQIGDALRYHIDDFHDKVERCKEYAEKEDKKNYYEEYGEKYDRLGDDQYHNIGVITEGLNWEHDEKVPYAQHCNLAGVLRMDPYEDWEMRALELLHNSVLVNKSELAKTKALMEEELTQSEIAERLGKSPSTVSRQVSQIENLNQRAEWHVENT